MAKYHTVMVFPLNILQKVKVVYVCRCHVVGMYDTRSSAKRVEFVAEVVHVLRGTIVPRGSMLYVSLAHRASFGTCVLAHLDRLGVDAEHKLPCINSIGNGLTDVFAKQTCQLPAWLNCLRVIRLGISLGHSLHRRVKR